MKIASCVLAAASFFAASAYAFNEGAVALHESNENDPDNGMMGAWFSSKQLPLNKLQEQFPSVHSATVQRFYSAFGQESTKMLAAYTDWKKTRVRPSTGDDASDWKQAMAESFSYYAVRGNLRGSSDSAEKGAPPEQQVMFATGLTDKEGYSVFQLLPARMDLGFDRSQEVYANSVSSYIETKLENNPPEVTVLIDARAGRGWPNPEMTSMLSAIKATSNSISKYHPERLHRCVIYPVPSFALTFWKLIAPFIDKAITEKIILLPGTSCGRHAPIPKKELKEYLDEASIDVLESRRLDLFNPK